MKRGPGQFLTDEAAAVCWGRHDGNCEVGAEQEGQKYPKDTNLPRYRDTNLDRIEVNLISIATG